MRHIVDFLRPGRVSPLGTIKVVKIPVYTGEFKKPHAGTSGVAQW